MLQSLRPPTDNLYKFMSIAGLVCFVLGVVLAVQTTRKTVELAYAGEAAAQEAWLALGEGFEEGDDEAAFKLIIGAWKQAEAGEDPFGLTQEARKLGTLSDEQLAAVRRYEVAVETFADQTQIEKMVRILTVVLMGGALAVMSFGFGFWYFRTQRYQDRLLRMQVEQQTPEEHRDGPARAGRKWTPEEEAKLRKGFDGEKTYKVLARAHGRTPGAIRSRLLKLGLIEIEDAGTDGAPGPAAGDGAPSAEAEA